MTRRTAALLVLSLFVMVALVGPLSQNVQAAGKTLRVSMVKFHEVDPVDANSSPDWWYEVYVNVGGQETRIYKSSVPIASNVHELVIGIFHDKTGITAAYAYVTVKVWDYDPDSADDLCDTGISTGINSAVVYVNMNTGEWYEVGDQSHPNKTMFSGSDDLQPGDWDDAEAYYHFHVFTP